LRFQVKGGEASGFEGEITYESNEVDLVNLKSGERVIVGREGVGERERFYLSDHYRLPVLFGLCVLLFGLAAVFGGMAALRAFLGLGLSLFIIVWFVFPSLLSGANPVLITLISAFILGTVGLTVAHGLSAKTIISSISIMVTALFAFAIAAASSALARLSGLSTEEAFLLNAEYLGIIDMRGLLLAGIILGTLGVLDDVATAQSAAVLEIHNADKSVSLKELYTRSARVGREHITALINTLILAYAGASLPLFLLFSAYDRPLWLVANSEVVFTELLRMISGSIALLLCVPLSTLLMSIYCHYRYVHSLRRNS